MLTTSEVAAELCIGREAARKLMQNTRGVVTLPPLNGTGKNETRRMPRAVFEALLAQRSKPRQHALHHRGLRTFVRTSTTGIESKLNTSRVFIDFLAKECGCD
jgi:hypothetical protein